MWILEGIGIASDALQKLAESAKFFFLFLCTKKD